MDFPFDSSTVERPALRRTGSQDHRRLGSDVGKNIIERKDPKSLTLTVHRRPPDVLLWHYKRQNDKANVEQLSAYGGRLSDSQGSHRSHAGNGVAQPVIERYEQED